MSVQETAVPGAVLEALNLEGVIWFGGNKDEYIVVLGTPVQVEAVRPDLEQIRRLPVSRVLVTAVAVEDDRVHVGGHAITITRGEWIRPRA